MRQALVTQAFHSRGVAAAAGVCTLAALWAFYAYGYVEPIEGDRGFALPSANEWLPDGLISFVAAIAANSAVVLVVALLCKVYNILRSMTGLYITLFAALQLSVPQLADQFYTGPVLAMAVMTGLYLLFGCYRSPVASGHVFLVFMMLSALTATQYCFAVFVPAFLVVCVQMRIFNGRTLVAALVGLVTPWWLLLGFGIITLDDIHIPHFQSLFDGMDFTDRAITLAAIGFAGVLLILSIVLNLFKTIAYNAHSRAVNGAVTVAAIIAIAGVCLDFSNIFAYVPLLNICAAIQTAHFFSTHRADRSYIPMAAIVAVCVALYVCQTQI